MKQTIRIGLGLVASLIGADAYAHDSCKIDYLERRIECLESPGTRLGAMRACRQEAEREYITCLGKPIVEPFTPASTIPTAQRRTRVKALSVGEAEDYTPLSPLLPKK
jgi:hypothetical protein